MLAVTVRRACRMLGFDIDRRRPLVADLLARHRIDTVLDVGANVGQCAKRLRAWGFKGRIVSFEPLPAAFRTLERNAGSDPLWDVVNVGLGDADTTAKINVSEASVFSSLLEGLPGLHSAYRTSVPVKQEEITLRRLDSVLPEVRGDSKHLFLKVDTQGYERHVLHGATEALSRIVGVQLEISLTPLYQGEATLVEMVRLMDERGFEIASIEPLVFDPRTDNLLQVDSVFINRTAGVEGFRANPGAARTVCFPAGSAPLAISNARHP
jgi:FkbM family methyltransferase